MYYAENLTRRGEFRKAFFHHAKAIEHSKETIKLGFREAKGNLSSMYISLSTTQMLYADYLLENGGFNKAIAYNKECIESIKSAERLGESFVSEKLGQAYNNLGVSVYRYAMKLWGSNEPEKTRVHLRNSIEHYKEALRYRNYLARGNLEIANRDSHIIS